MTREDIFAAIVKERERQATKWSRDHIWGHGDCSSHRVSSMVKVAVVTEEAGEVARAVLDDYPEQLRDELVQLAAVCVAWLEAL